MNRPAKVPISEQAQRAREHYEELANMAHHWSSVIPQAIDAWERERLANNRMHQTAFGVLTVVFFLGFSIGAVVFNGLCGGW